MPASATTPRHTRAGDSAAAEANRLMEAAWTVAARTGSIDVPVRDVLAEAGLATKAFYRHFGSKDELLLAAMQRGAELLVAALERRMAAATDPVARIDAYVTGFIRAAAPGVASRHLPWAVGINQLSARFPDEVDERQTIIVEVLRSAIVDARRAGAVTSPNALQDAWLIFGCTLDLLLRSLSHGVTPKPRSVAHLVDFVHRALGVGATVEA